MGYLIRVLKGNVSDAMRQLTRHAQVDGHLKLYQRNLAHVKPTQARRQARAAGIRRRENAQLHHNLRVVFARKARGF